MSEGIIIALIGLVGTIIEAYATLAAAKTQHTNPQNTPGTTRRSIFFSRIPRTLLFLILIVVGFWTWSNSLTFLHPRYIDEVNEEYFRQLIRDIDTAQSQEVRNSIVPFTTLPLSESGISGVHGPSGINVPPRCYGLAWNVRIGDVSYTDRIVVILEQTEIEVFNDIVFKGYYITVCHKGELRFSPQAIGKIQAAIMDQDNKLDGGRRWESIVLD